MWHAIVIEVYGHDHDNALLHEFRERVVTMAEEERFASLDLAVTGVRPAR